MIQILNALHAEPRDRYDFHAETKGMKYVYLISWLCKTHAF